MANPNPRVALGIDLGGSSVKSAWLTDTGDVLARATREFDDGQPMAWADAVLSIFNHIPEGVDQQAARVGVSAPGLASKDRRRIQCMPGRLAGLEGLEWTKFLARGKPVPVLNDAQAALRGECWLGAGRGVSDAILITLGTGVGGAAMVDGNLLRGRIGRAGHLGHTVLDVDAPADVCLAPGSLEQMIGNCTVEIRSGGRFKSTQEVIEAFKAGDPVAASVWLRSLKQLAGAIASFINILDPQRVIIGGGIARAGDLLFKPLQAFLDPMEWRPDGTKAILVPAELGEFAGAFGAAHAALEPDLRETNTPFFFTNGPRNSEV